MGELLEGAMAGLMHVIYHSAARGDVHDMELALLLAKAREQNARLGVTGILLYSERTFFQVLEGDAEVLDRLMGVIAKDTRHTDIVMIIREPVARRAFADWTMGYVGLASEELGSIIGMNDFFGANASFARVDSGRAKKLLEAFREGRWRSRITGKVESPVPGPGQVQAVVSAQDFSFAFQPIVDAEARTVVSYEALIRGVGNQPAPEVLQRVAPGQLHAFDERCRIAAIALAARLGLPCNLNLNFLPLSVETSQTSITSTLEAAQRCGIAPGRIVLEILESEIISDHDGFARAIDVHRGAGLRTAIDDFGAGYAGLNLLADFLPDMIKLDMSLIRDVERKGPRQAILRGVQRTCQDLGIDVLAEGVETRAEYDFLREEGITLFQGRLFAQPAFEQLPPASFPAP